jgi:hypothetical protein
MSLASLRGRLGRIEAARGGPCDGVPTVWLFYRAGEERPPVPADARPCPKCSIPHPLFIRRQIVGPDYVVPPGGRFEVDA